MILISKLLICPVVSRDDWIDLFRLSMVPNGKVNVDGDAMYSITLSKVANRHLYCSTLGGPAQCNLDAAAGAYVDPQGRLLLYATEHDNDGPGGSVKMMEFRPSNHLDNPDTTIMEGCPSMTSAFVELFETTGKSGFSQMIDYVDRNRRSLSFGTASSFDDKTRSARFCLPPGQHYRMFRNADRTGTVYDLVGTGATTGVSWSSNPGWSSGCFFNGVSCM